MLKVVEMVELVKTYGEDVTLGDLLKKIQGDRVHKCPKCNGEGKITETYDAYPTNAPDYGWVHDYRTRDIKCDLCDGHGYTNIKYVPKYKEVIEGYEEA